MCVGWCRSGSKSGLAFKRFLGGDACRHDTGVLGTPSWLDTGIGGTLGQVASQHASTCDGVVAPPRDSNGLGHALGRSDERLVWANLDTDASGRRGDRADVMHGSQRPQRHDPLSESICDDGEAAQENGAVGHRRGPHHSMYGTSCSSRNCCKHEIGARTNAKRRPTRAADLPREARLCSSVRKRRPDVVARRSAATWSS